MSRQRLKVDPKFDGSVHEMDSIWVCDECKTTYAGGKAWTVYDITFQKKCLCGQCVRKRITDFQKGIDGLIEKMKEDN